MFQTMSNPGFHQLLPRHVRYVLLLLLLSSCVLTTVAAYPVSILKGAALPPLYGNPCQNEQGTNPLKSGEPVEQELAGGQTRSYQLQLVSNQFLHVVVEQRGIDVLVALFGPDGKKLAEVDSPGGTSGIEPIFGVAQIPGSYRIEVRSPDKDAEPGRYQIRIEELRAATLQDENVIAAQSSYAEGLQQQGEATAESFQKAVEKYKQSLRLWRERGNREREATTLYNLGSVTDNLDEKQKALDYYNQAISLMHALGIRIEEGALLSNIGKVYSDLGENQKAIDFYSRALVIHQSTGDRMGENITLNNIALIFQDWGEPQKALEYFRKSLQVTRGLGDAHEIALRQNNMGAVYEELAEYQMALDSYEDALRSSRQARDGRSEARTLSNIGKVYSDLGDYQKALEYYNQSLPLRRTAGDRRGEANTLSNMGKALEASGEPQNALEDFTQALTLWREVGDRGGEAITLNNLGKLYDDLGQQQKAFDYYGQALKLMKAVGDRQGEATTLNNTGKLFDNTGEKQKALDYYKEALQIERAVSDRRGEATTLYNMARYERDRGDLDAARSRISTALDIVESLRLNVSIQELRSAVFASYKDYYEFYIDLLMRLHRVRPSEGHDAEAFEASERARARSLLELLAESSADIRQGADPLLLERERSLQNQLNLKAERQMRLLNSPHAGEQAANIAKEITSLTTSLQQVEAQIRVKSPKYAALTQPQPLRLRDLQTRVLDPNTLLLEYELGNERSYLWAVTQTSLDSYELPGRAEIEAPARRIYELLTARNRRVEGETTEQRRARVAQADAEYTRAASSLSRTLLGPVAAKLGDKRLLIVSDGALQYLPFAVLPDPASALAASTIEKQSPLIVSHEMVNLPSASALAVLRLDVKGRKAAARALAVLADPVFSKDDERVLSNAARRSNAPATASRPPAQEAALRDVMRVLRDVAPSDSPESLPRLAGTRLEARAITSLLPERESMQALDFAANRNTATSAALSQFRIVHFATHAVIDNIHPELSGIVLSLVDEEGRAQDGFLRLHEIFNLKLPAELVVLSACRSGLGKEIKGEGLIGLTRGFMYAGARRVVVSLWSVNDRATAYLMARFYKKMFEKGRANNAAAALRSAQVEMWREGRWPSPYYWGAFILQGEW
jgi:CHAT domain-containing protein/tetratricopeptide (TPR) repeat protein